MDVTKRYGGEGYLTILAVAIIPDNPTKVALSDGENVYEKLVCTTTVIRD